MEENRKEVRFDLNSVGRVYVCFGETLGCKSTHIELSDFDENYFISDEELVDIVMKLAHGVDVEVNREAVVHNYDAWKRDYKSGYRDEVNDVFVFTPCGCNPLSFDFSVLTEGCEKWQKTYKC